MSVELLKKNSKHGKDSTDSDEWEVVNWDYEENSNEIRNLGKIRLEIDVRLWCNCKCSFCKIMPVNRECLCCVEIDEIKFKKLSDGMYVLRFLFNSFHITHIGLFKVCR